jgi:hypothetical protein
MSAYRTPSIVVLRVCAVCGTSDRKLHTPREVGARLCMPCVLSPDSLAVLEAVKDGRITPAGAEVLIDLRGARRRTAFLPRVGRLCGALWERLRSASRA